VLTAEQIASPKQHLEQNKKQRYTHPSVRNISRFHHVDLHVWSAPASCGRFPVAGAGERGGTVEGDCQQRIPAAVNRAHKLFTQLHNSESINLHLKSDKKFEFVEAYLCGEECGIRGVD
jgi:hypothetical protein